MEQIQSEINDILQTINTHKSQISDCESRVSKLITQQLMIARQRYEEDSLNKRNELNNLIDRKNNAQSELNELNNQVEKFKRKIHFNEKDNQVEELLNKIRDLQRNNFTRYEMCDCSKYFQKNTDNNLFIKNIGDGTFKCLICEHKKYDNNNYYDDY